MAARLNGIVIAYACDPRTGSEPAAGWGIVRSLASFADCVVLVGPEHADGLREWQAAHADDTTRFVVVKEPAWTGFVPRTRTGRFVIYLGWLSRAGRYARSLDLHRVDFAWHATYAAYWLPTPAASLGLPCVWGPVGGGVTAPRALWPSLGLRGLVGELVDYIAVRLMACLPPTRRTWRGATMPLVQNHQTLARLPEHLRRRAVVLNHAVFAEIAAPPTGPRGSTVVFAGRLEARKAPWLAIHALAYAPAPVHLLMIGDGPERRRLAALARRLGVERRVTFAGQLARPAVLQALRSAAAAVFTGVREEGGIALAEAIQCGTPVIVLAHGGARTVAESAAATSRVSLIEPQSADVTARAIAVAMTRFVSAAPVGATLAPEERRNFATEAATIAAAAIARHHESGQAAGRIKPVMNA